MGDIRGRKGGALGGLAAVADIDKAKNSYLNDKQSVKKEVIMKLLPNFSAEQRMRLVNQGAQAQLNALKAQTLLDTAMFNYQTAKNYGYGNSFINPQTGQPFILDPTAQYALHNQLGTETDLHTVVPQAKQTFDYYSDNGKSQQPQSNNAPQGALTGGISDMTQDRPFHIGQKPSDLKMITDQYAKGTQQAISQQRAQNTAQHQRVLESQGQQRVNQGAQKAKAYINNANSQIDARKIKNLDEIQSTFVSDYLQLKQGQDPDLKARVDDYKYKYKKDNPKPMFTSDEAYKSQVNGAVKKYNENLKNSYLLKAQQQFAKNNKGKDIESFLKAVNKADNFKAIEAPPPEFEIQPMEQE